MQFALWLEHAWTHCLHRIRTTLPGRCEDWALYRHPRGARESWSIVWMSYLQSLIGQEHPRAISGTCQGTYARVAPRSGLAVKKMQLRRSQKSTPVKIYQSNSKHVKSAFNSCLFVSLESQAPHWSRGCGLRRQRGGKYFPRPECMTKELQKTWFTFRFAGRGSPFQSRSWGQSRVCLDNPN